MSRIRIATRRSPLARAQSSTIAAGIAAATGFEVELVGVDSLGDRSTAPLTGFGGVGVFVTAVREAVMDGRADLAVHSLKDLPTAVHAGVHLLAVPPREDPRDALVSAFGGLRDLPTGARVGTGSPRRRAQLLALRPDLQVVDIRGNVDTRLRKVDSGDLGAVVLARAGLIRLGMADRITEVLPGSDMLPAPGQGALAVECATETAEGFAAVAAALDHSATRACVTAERSALARLEAGCAAPMGALARMGADCLEVDVAVFAPDGSAAMRARTRGPAGEAMPLGHRAAAELLDLGAGRLLGESVP